VYVKQHALGLNTLRVKLHAMLFIKELLEPLSESLAASSVPLPEWK
jgi:hypothetical protein